MQDLRLKTQNYARFTLKNAKLCRNKLKKTQNDARSTLKNAKLCKI